MFESDDFDQVLSQFDYIVNDVSSVNKNATEVQAHRQPSNEETNFRFSCNSLVNTEKEKHVSSVSSRVIKENMNTSVTCQMVSPIKHTKRKMINSFFDHQAKRKFPGPAGLLTGTIEDNSDNNLCQMELLSQDVDFSQNHLSSDVFKSPLWKRLQQDVEDWQLGRIDSIKTIKQQALAGNLLKRKAETITAFVETVDRSVSDPLITLRDVSGKIKCTLHRDAWCTFSAYIVSECCALVLWKPTVLTTGGAFKKHYLNITLSNIMAIYSTTVLNNEADPKPLPEGYEKVLTETFTIIKIEKCPFGDANNILALNSTNHNDYDFLDGLDSSVFLEELQS